MIALRTPPLSLRVAGPLVLMRALSGCGGKGQEFVPDRPLPFDGGKGFTEDAKPFVRDAARDAIREAETDSGCIPDPCSTGVTLKNPQPPFETTCIRFKEVHEAAGLLSTGPHHGVSVVDYDGDGWSDIFVLNDTGNVM